MFNAAQPIRPDYTEDGTPLLYRTQPKKQTRLPKFYSIQQILASFRLYRAARRGDVPLQVPIGDLYDFCMEGIYDIVSKNAMGHAVINSVLYEPRKLLNRKDIKATMTYRFLHPLDLTYGLEWQLSVVLYQWLADICHDFPKDRDEWQSEMESLLDELGTSEFTHYLKNFEEPIIEDNAELSMMEPEWSKIMTIHAERKVSNKPQPTLREMTRPKPRDVSAF